MRNTLTHDMTRLRSEIDRDRDNRAKLLAKLHDERYQLAEYVTDFLTTFREQHAEITQRDRAYREACLAKVSRDVDSIRQNVVTLRKGFQDDILGARQAWAGIKSVEKKAPVLPPQKSSSSSSFTKAIKPGGKTALSPAPQKPQKASSSLSSAITAVLKEKTTGTDDHSKDSDTKKKK